MELTRPRPLQKFSWIVVWPTALDTSRTNRIPRHMDDGDKETVTKISRAVLQILVLQQGVRIPLHYKILYCEVRAYYTIIY